MKNQETKQLVKIMTEKKKELKNKNIQIEKTTILKRPRVDKKYVTESNYKELLVLYDLLKGKPELNDAEVASLIEKSEAKFPFLKECLDSIYNFVTELKCNGPYYIAKEMSRQGKEIDYINKNLIND